MSRKTTAYAPRVLRRRTDYFPAQAIKQGKIESISMEVVRSEATLAEIMQSLLTYAQAFEEDYGVCFVIARITYNEEVVMFSNVLTAIYEADQIRYNRVSRMIVKHLGGLHLHEKLRKDPPAAETCEITPLGDPILYMFLKTISFS